MILALMLAMAPPGGLSGPDTIDVIARTPEQARREAQQFVRALGVTEQPVARWVDPVCPKAIGVAPAIAARVEARIRTVAEAARVRIARGRCKGNILVAFTTNAGAVVKQVAGRLPNALENVPVGDRAALYTGDAPIRWWHTVETRNRDGDKSLSGDTPPAIGVQNGTDSVALGGQVYQQYRGSFLSTQIVRVLTSATIVVDVTLAEGKPLDSVAAFAALVGLAEVRAADEPPPDSILSLSSPNGPTDLTAVDTRFLAALYRLPLDRTAIAQRGLLVRGLTSVR